MIRKLLTGGLTVVAIVIAFSTQAPDAYGQDKQPSKAGVACWLKCARAHNDEITSCAKSKCKDKCPQEHVKTKDVPAECKSCVDACAEPFKKPVQDCQAKCPK